MKEAALILEGGATRGMFTAGALDYMMEQELWFSYVIGVSAGACNAVDYVSKQIGRTRMSFIQMNEKTSLPQNVRRVLKSRQLYDMDRIFDEIPNVLLPFDYETYFRSPITCELVTTNCLTGKPEYFSENEDRKRLLTICRASSSLPLVSTTTEIDGVPYFDGGLSDSIPLAHVQKKGFEKIVVILTQNPGYRKGINKTTRRLCRHFYSQYPKLIETIYRRPYEYNRVLYLIEQLEADGKIFVLRPTKTPPKKTDTDSKTLLAFYEHGYEVMKEQYEAMLAYLED